MNNIYGFHRFHSNYSIFTTFRTFTRPSPSRNLTFDKDTTDLLANLSIDKDEQDWKNQTFTRKRLSRDSSEGFEDDRGSVNSENSSGHHRLNDVDDVMTLARLQEESKYFSFFHSVKFFQLFYSHIVEKEKIAFIWKIFRVINLHLH